MVKFAYTKTQLNGTPQPRYIFSSYRDKKKLNMYTNSKVYTLIDNMYPRQYNLR